MVRADRDDTAREVLVCMTISSGPSYVPSFVDRCERCGARVWRSNRSAGFMGGVECMPCHVLHDPPGEVRLAPWVGRDLAGK